MHAKLLLRFRARFFRLQEKKRGMRDVFDRFSLPRERLARGEPAEIFSSLLRLLFSLSVSCFYRRRSFRRGLHRVFLSMYLARGNLWGEKLEKKKSTFSLHFLPADGSMFTMKLPHLLLLPLLLGCALLSLSISLYFSLPRWFLSCHHRLNVVPFFFYVYPKTLLFVTVILDGIFSFVARACVHIFTRFSLSLRFKCIARVYIYIARERKKKHTPQALFLLRLSREEVNDKNRLWELQ